MNTHTDTATPNTAALAAEPEGRRPHTHMCPECLGSFEAMSDPTEDGLPVHCMACAELDAGGEPVMCEPCFEAALLS